MRAPVQTNRGGMQTEAAPVFSNADPGSDLVPIVPNDVTTFAYRAIRCGPSGTAGTIKVDTAAGTTRTTNIAVGETLSLAITRLYATGTTAAGLEGYV